MTYNFDDLYAEHEYTFGNLLELDKQDYADYDYALLDTRLNVDLGLLPDAPIVYEMKVDHATLVMIQKIPKQDRGRSWSFSKGNLSRQRTSPPVTCPS